MKKIIATVIIGLALNLSMGQECKSYPSTVKEVSQVIVREFGLFTKVKYTKFTDFNFMGNQILAEVNGSSYSVGIDQTTNSSPQYGHTYPKPFSEIMAKEMFFAKNKTRKTADRFNTLGISHQFCWEDTINGSYTWITLVRNPGEKPGLKPEEPVVAFGRFMR